jgi:hypothetical protein
LDNLHIQIACSKFSLPWAISKLCQSFHVFYIANSKRTLRADIPSFDLGIAFSPQQKSYQTPVPHTSQALLSRVPSPNSCHQTSEERLSSNNAKLSPKTTTLNHANTILYDQMALLDEASSQQDEVLYGQLVRGTYEKGHVPNHHIDTSVSISSQRHPGLHLRTFKCSLWCYRTITPSTTIGTPLTQRDVLKMFVQTINQLICVYFAFYVTN